MSSSRAWPRRRPGSLAAVMSALDDVWLVDAASEHEVRAGDLWEQRPVALIFLRHYG
jgi:hypothetical protein